MKTITKRKEQKGRSNSVRSHRELEEVCQRTAAFTVVQCVHSCFLVLFMEAFMVFNTEFVMQTMVQICLMSYKPFDVKILIL